jgi:enoyl-CoA hydratase
MSDDSVVVAHDGPVTTIGLNRPDRRNAVDGTTAEALAAAFRAFDEDPGAAVAVLHGHGPAFCAGADLHAVGTDQGNRIERDGDGPMGPPSSACSAAAGESRSSTAARCACPG